MENIRAERQIEMNGFETFGREHILWILMLAAAGAAIVFADNRAEIGNSESGRTGIRKEKIQRAKIRKEEIRRAEIRRMAAAVLAASGRVLPGIYYIVSGSYGLDSLPLHVCSMAGYGCFLHFLLTTGKDRNGRTGLEPQKEPGHKPASALRTALSELLFFPGLPGAFLALLFPGWNACPPFSFLSCCEFLGHGGIVLYVILRMQDGSICPSFRRMWIPVVFCAVYAAVMIPFDRITGTNYGFLLLPAPASPLSVIAFAAGLGPGYYIGYTLLVLFLMIVFYVAAALLKNAASWLRC